MVSYKVIIQPSAKKELRALPADIQKEIFPKIEALAEHYMPKGVVKLKSQKNIYRLRVGHYRIIYEIGFKKKSITIFRIRHRKDAYKEF
jgi:mRNA interferase RelE/StbE